MELKDYNGVKRFNISEFDNSWAMKIEIDFEFPNIKDAIQQSVEFWGGWEMDLEYNDGDYVKTFLQNIAVFSIKHSSSGMSAGFNFENKEGYPYMDGKHGIKIVDSDILDFDNSNFEIEEII